MPIHPSWEKIRENFREQYGDRWEEVWWAWMNKHGYDETKPADEQIKEEECKREEDKGRPPKDWFERCVESVSKNPDVEDPEALCGWIWYHGKEEELSEENVKRLNEEYEKDKLTSEPPLHKDEGEEMLIEYLEHLIKEVEEALDELEDEIERKSIRGLPVT